ncbi:hypothetical protein [Streptomyces sp. NPDC090025]|uniref:hypothetical protein n=1 Tax=Streptomyces sp. NPDC090025 TaxID=3365922 RepID=UPI0038337F0D
MIRHDAPEEARRISLLYWEVKENGTWARTVSSIGVTGDVGAVATGHSHAVLLDCPCANCSEPIAVTNRSWANKIGGKHLDAEAPPYLCPDCTAVQRQEEDERRQRAEEARRAEQERVERLIGAALKDEDAKSEPAGPLAEVDPRALALYAALVQHATGGPGNLLPSLTAVGPLGWTGDTEQDGEFLLSLYAAGLLALARESPTEAFLPTEDDEGVTFYVADVAWRLVGGPAARRARAEEITYTLLTRPGPDGAAAREALRTLTAQAETADVIAYLNGVLGRQHSCPETPEARRDELAGIIRKGFEHGYSTGQMFCFAWGAARSAATWRDETPGVGAPEAASASVTGLKTRIGKAIECGYDISAYDVPRWHRAPLALDGLRTLREDIRRVYDRAVIDACTRCDQQGFKETVRAGTGTKALWRCTHPVEIPAPDPVRTATPDPVGIPTPRQSPEVKTENATGTATEGEVLRGDEPPPTASAPSPSPSAQFVAREP